LFTKASSVWGKVQDVGGAGINFAELVDRGLSVSVGLQTAAMKGYTIEQALYGTFDVILKDNFLSREFNPAWLRRPVVRMMAMFQATPFKIMERRLVNFSRSGIAVKDLGKTIYELTSADVKNGDFKNTKKILTDLRNIRSDVKKGEQIMKANIFLHSAMRETDFFGSPIVNNFARDMMIVGAATYGGQSVGMNLSHHFFHVPFFNPGTPSFTLRANPLLNAVDRGYADWKAREENDDDFITTKIFQRWLGKGWYKVVPDPLIKWHRISKNDIPEMYQGSPYKYLFSIPATKDK
jgi:hypothetical protein